VTGDPAETAAEGDGEPGEGSEASEAGAATQEHPPGTASGRVFAPPSVRRLARERGVDLGTVTGSGPGGRVTAADVQEAGAASGAADADVEDAITQVAPEADVGGDSATRNKAAAEGQPRPNAAVRRRSAEDAEEPTAAAAPGQPEAADRDQTLAAPATRRRAEELDVDLDAVPTDKARHGEPFVEPADAAAAVAEARTAAAASSTADSGTGGQRETTREPYRGVRRTIGQQMAESAFTAPHATHHDRAVVTSLVEAREAMQPRAEERGVSLTYVPFVLKAVVAGLREYPVLNTSLDEEAEEVVYKHYYDVGVATATEAGLMVPVVRDVDEQDILDLAAQVNDLVEKARDRSIAREEMQGGTFTITNFGAIGGEYATPIINYPETAILGLGSIEQRPVVVDGGTTSSSRGASGATAGGEVEARHTLPLSLSIDHRVIDGADAARFVNTVIEYLENPSLLLLE
jgi:pyruvate dehydrogenase E2 component (dihydrolipoamide acetyltransferase)